MKYVTDIVLTFFVEFITAGSGILMSNADLDPG
jgi:hypothetical protein